MACVWQCPSHLEFRERLHFHSITLVTCLGAKSCPGRCISNSSCIVSRGTQVWTVQGWVGPVSCCVRWQWVDKLGVIRCKHFVLVGSCSAPFLLYRLFIEGKLLMIPWTKTSEKEATSFSSTTHLKCRNICSRMSYFEFNHFQPKLLWRNESNIDLELLYVGLTNSSSAKKCS